MGRKPKKPEDRKPAEKRFFINLEQDTRRKYELAARLSENFRWNGKGSAPRLVRALLDQLSEKLTAGEILRAAEGDFWGVVIEKLNSDKDATEKQAGTPDGTSPAQND